MSLTDAQAKITQAVTALESDDFATATRLIDSAELLMSVVADSEQGDAKLEFARNQIENVRNAIRKRRAAKVGFIRIKARFPGGE